MGIASSGDNDTHLVGGTDQTTIGNVADSVKVNVTNLPATQPVSGTVTANQGGAWNITNVSGTVSLPTGAATSSLQTTTNSSLASLVTNTSSLTLAQGSTTSGQTGALMLAAVTTGSPSYTNGQTDAISLTTAGAVRTDSSAVTQPVSGTVTNLPGVATAATYGAAIVDLVTGSVPQDIFTITGSGTKTVYIWEIRVSGNTGSPAEDFYILKRSTANSGGTSTTLTAVPYDSLSAAATATVRAYTANPTSPGTLIGHVRAANINIKQPQQQIWPVSFGVGSTQPMVLRGTSEVLAINANGVAITGSAMALSITWTEV